MASDDDSSSTVLIHIRNSGNDALRVIKNKAIDMKEEYVEFIQEIRSECFPSSVSIADQKLAVYSSFRYFVNNWTHLPYFPAFHRPGWLLRYIVGPYDSAWGSSTMLYSYIHIYCDASFN